ncbi:MAG: glycosyltransferase family 4 protein [Planctomycetota bacterium]
MRVLLINQVYAPDVAATAQHAEDLSRHLVDKGHEVHVITSRSLYGKAGASLPKQETLDGVRVHRVGQSFFGKGSILARVADFGLFYLLAVLKAFAVPRADVVVPFTTPPFIVLAGWFLRLTRGSKLVYWVMDLYPDLPIACGVMGERSLPARFFEGLHRFALKKADRVVVLGRCMRDRVLSKGVPAERVTHIGVWSPNDIDPGEDAMASSETPYRKSWGLGDRFTVMYSGNFGLGHDVETMCEAARTLSDDPAWRDRVRFLFVGGGKKKTRVEAFVREHGLSNCVLDAYQPREKLEQSLAAGDLHLASLTEGIEGIMVPCKLFGIMGAGRPCAFIGHPTSELARVLAENDAGFNVRQGDAAGLVEIVKTLADDWERAMTLGRNARRALASAYDRSAACEAWRAVLEAVAVSGNSRSADILSKPGSAAGGTPHEAG